MADFNGSSIDDIWTGSDAGEIAVGNGGDDTLSGAGGNDFLIGNAGADVLNGGDGDDFLFSSEESATLYGGYYVLLPPVLDTGTEVDTLTGGDGSDIIFAGYGDNIDGGANGPYGNGDDLFISFVGAPTGVTVDFGLETQVVGGGTITGIENVSWVEGSNFDDNITIAGGSGKAAVAHGMGGNDSLVAGYYTRDLYGDDGNDTLDGRSSQYLNVIDGGAGDDTLYERGGLGAIVDGGAGNDTIHAGATTHGGDGDDHIYMDFTYYSGVVTGDAGNDEIHGAASSANYLHGGAGADLVYGGASNDQLYTDSAANFDSGLEKDVLAGFGANDLLSIGYGDDADGGSETDTLYLSLAGATSGVTLDTAGIGSGQSVAVLGGTINSIENSAYLRASAFADTLTLATQSTQLEVDAGAGDDQITASGSSVLVRGEAGDDRFVSGLAGDTFDGGAGMDTADFSAATGPLTVDLQAGSAFGNGVGTDTLTSVENVRGGVGNDSIAGDAANNVLDGAAGDDVLRGGVGADSLIGGAGADTVDYGASNAGIVVRLWNQTASGGHAEGDALSGLENAAGGSFNDSLIGSDGANILAGDAGGDYLNGLAGNDALDGGAGDDALSGGAGADALDGGSGTDTADYRNSTAGVTVRLWNGTGQNGDAQGDALSDVENVTGSGLADSLIGADAIGNVLDGGAGNDFLAGLSGDDALSGATGADRLDGGAGDDALTGGAGADALDGGSGTDTAAYANSAAGVTVRLWNGTGQNGDAQGDTLSNVENLTGSGLADSLIGADGVGNVLDGGAGNDFLAGLSGDDFLDGGAGADRLDGGAGADTASYVNAPGGVQVSLVSGFGTGSHAQGDALTNVERIAGSAFADVLTGDGGANALSGGAGDDALSGGAGADALDGGSGTDAADYASSAAGVIVRLWNGTGQNGDAQGDALSNIENVTGSGLADSLIGADAIGNILDGGAGNDFLAGLSGDDALFGAAGVDQLDGGAGNDALNGGAGADALVGGAGTDTVDYSGSDAGVIVRLWNQTASGGHGQGDTLSGFENASGGSFNDSLIGSVGSNVLSGGAGNDVLDGGPGADVLIGGAGTDTVDYSGSDAGVVVTLWNQTATGGHGQGDALSGFENAVGGSFNDSVIGSVEANVLSGGAGDDHVDGLAGDDVLAGGAGNDMLVDGLGLDDLTGGAGSDGFVFSVEAGASDVVRDFEDGLDAILLPLIYQDATMIAAHAEGTLISIDLGGEDWSVLVEGVTPDQLTVGADILFWW